MNYTKRRERHALVKYDEIVETHHFRRVVRLTDGPILEMKKNDRGYRYKFQVRDIAVFWNEGGEVDHVIAFGRAVNDKKLHCKRRYSPNKLPQELIDILGDLKGAHDGRTTT